MSEIDTCKHGSSLLSECFDCNEQEIYDNILNDVLNEIIKIVFDKHFILGDLIETAMSGTPMDNDDEVRQRIINNVNDILRLTNQVRSE